MFYLLPIQFKDALCIKSALISVFFKAVIVTVHNKVITQVFLDFLVLL
jgi:hypothetical protein